MSLYVPLDVDYQLDPKIISAGPMGENLFIRSLALSKRTMSDGRIDREQLPSLCLGLPGPPRRHAETLVRVGLWLIMDYGWLIAAWAKRNRSAAAITEKSEFRRDAAVKGNHERWHTGPTGKPSVNCPICYPSLIAKPSQNGSQTDRKAESDRYPIGSQDESPKTKTESEPKEESESKEKTTTGASRKSDRHRINRNGRSSSQVSQSVTIAARAVWHQNESQVDTTPEQYQAGVVRTMLAERGDEIDRWLAGGKTPVEVAGELAKSQIFANAAARELGFLEGSTHEPARP